MISIDKKVKTVLKGACILTVPTLLYTNAKKLIEKTNLFDDEKHYLNSLAMSLEVVKDLGYLALLKNLF